MAPELSAPLRGQEFLGHPQMEEHLRKTYMVTVRPDEGLASVSDSSDELEWKMVCQMVKDYARVHPKEMADLKKDNRVLRESTFNQYGSSSQGALRWGFRLPPGLVRLIDRRFPRFLVTKSKIHRFMEQFQDFRVCETV